MSAVEADFDDPLRAGLNKLGDHWGMVLVFGLASIVLGIIVLVWPGKTLVVVAILFGIWLFVSGIVQLIQAFSPGLDGGGRALFAISAVCSLILGVLCVRGGFTQTLEILALLLGLAWLIRGAMDFFVALASKGAEGRGWAIFSGIVLFIGGIVVLVWPAPTLVALTLVAGIWLIVYGLFFVFGAFKVRGLRNA